MTSTISKVGEYIPITEQWIEEWDNLIWRASAECREMIHERLALVEIAMKEGTKSPYFDGE